MNEREIVNSLVMRLQALDRRLTDSATRPCTRGTQIERARISTSYFRTPSGGPLPSWKLTGLRNECANPKCVS
jgi:hypothetical protein